MNPTVNRVFTEAMSMPTELRALLVSQLLETLDDGSENKTISKIEDEVEHAHLNEVHRRLSEIKSGRVETISSDIAAERIRRVLGK